MRNTLNNEAKQSERVALVFGGSGCIGAAASRRLARDGFAIGLTYVSQPDRAQEVVDAVTADGGHAFTTRAESAHATAIDAAVEEVVAHFGRLDVAVINAGVLRLGTIDAFALDDLDQRPIQSGRPVHRAPTNSRIL